MYELSHKTSTHQTMMNSSCIDCWCSSRPGSRIVRKSCSISDASLINSTYSLCAKCNFRHAFWYLSRTSSNFRPPRPAETSKFNVWIRNLTAQHVATYLWCSALRISIAAICNILNAFGIRTSFASHRRKSTFDTTSNERDGRRKRQFQLK